MSKLSAEAFVKLQTLVEAGKVIKIEPIRAGIEITVWDSRFSPIHSHYQGEDLIEAVNNVASFSPRKDDDCPHEQLYELKVTTCLDCGETVYKD